VQPFLPWKIIKYYYNKMNGTIFGQRKVTEHKMYFDLFLQVSSETLLTLRRNERDMMKNVYWFSRKILVILSAFNKTFIASMDF